MAKWLEKILGDPQKKKRKAFTPIVEAIGALESEIQPLSDEELRQKTTDFKARLLQGETLDDIRDEAFAVVREAAMRTLGQRHYDVQLMGGLVLHQGSIAEMRTGEGKTLSATTAVYLNALSGKGVHIVTVNDYLARRDADWMGQVYHFLGLSVSCIQANGAALLYDADLDAVRRPEEGDAANASTDAEEPSTEGSGYEALIAADMQHLRAVERREAYAADITFGTNNEFGFDYLRDNMVQRPEQRVQRGLHFAVIDEVDSILIDEARTPLIISAPAQEATQQYYQFAQLVERLEEETHYTKDEKQRAASLTDEGIAFIEQALGVDNVYVEGGMRVVHHIEQALKARVLFTRDKDYVVKDGQVVIIDEFTGRMMDGRRYSEGLHQAIEAKEGVEIQQESRTLATITLQNYFRMYEKLSGMTGTAETEAEEFYKIYQLDVVVVPTHREIQRTDLSDRVYKNASGKFTAVIERVRELHEKGQPVLIGTISIEQNELLSRLLQQANLPHQVLNAKHHEQEAEIISQAGRRGSITVATNMAGRGVDIILGGNPVDIEEARAVRELGGLAVIGTERHESRRIDNQLRGRSGRQGDVGMSQFFVSMEDELMRIFGSDRMQNLMQTLGVPDDMPIENSMVTRSIESAQKKVESRNFDIRKHLVEYDDVMNKHRDTIYRRRNAILDAEDGEMESMVHELVDGEIAHIVSMHSNADDNDAEWNVQAMCDSVAAIVGGEVNSEDGLATAQSIAGADRDKLDDAQARTALIDHFKQYANASFDALAERLQTPEAMKQGLTMLYLRSMDTLWVEHLDQMSFLRDSIRLRGYGQRDPLVEYKRESYQLFQQLLGRIQEQVVQHLFRLELAPAAADKNTDLPELEDAQYSAPAKQMESEVEKREGAQPHHSDTPTTAEGKKIGRNDPCYCGSGKKYKKCHGAS